MNCPGCGFDNIQGNDACEECGMDLRSLDIPLPQEGLQQTILEDPLENLHPLNPLVVAPDTPIEQAIRLMKQANQGSVFVVEGNELAGILTERDLLMKVAVRPIDLKRTPVSNLMTHDPVALKAGDALAYALNNMSVGRYRHIPIVRDGRLTSFVSVRGVLRYIAEKLG
ncbi:MAG: CBS domain-containing protein [Acidobacteriota bacterium]